MENKNKIGFKEMTLSKYIVLFFCGAWLLTLIVVLVFFIAENVDLTEVFEIVSYTTSGVVAIYGGKSGYEYYSRSKYSSGNTINTTAGEVDGDTSYSEL